MPQYRIVLYDKDGLVAKERTADFSSDDEGVEHVAGIDRPHETCLWQESRLVVRCPPWTAVVPSGVTLMSPRDPGEVGS